VVVVLAGAALAGALAASAELPGHRHEARASARDGIHKIRHVVIIMQENRSFDSYFGTYPGADGIPMRDGRPSVCVPDPISGTCVRPFHDAKLKHAGGAHGSLAALMDIDHGKMDGFIATTYGGLVKRCRAAPQKPSCARTRKPDVMGYHDARELPNYWRYAQSFVLQDRMFAPTDSWTLPSHLYLVSAWSALCSDLSGPDPNAKSCKTSLTRPDRGWRPPDGKPRPYRWADITWLLHNHNVSWAYYVGPGTCVKPPCAATNKPATAPVIDVLPGFRTIEKTNQFGRIRPYSDYFSRAAHGKLPSVSWVVPVEGKGEHPPDNLRPGTTWVTKAVNAIMRGPRRQWMHTAIFLTWDDWGGFYDHVPPKRIDPYGYGIRVPGIVISPWVKRGLDVDHQTLSFDAYLKLIEDRFLGGRRLNGNNEGWPDPRPTIRENAVPGDLRKIFNFSQRPIRKLVLDPTPY
jgi:phospholipase C